jgi:hypothetical protein
VRLTDEPPNEWEANISFFSDLIEGHDSNLGNDLTHAGSSLVNHPDELAETLGGLAAAATGGLALGGGFGGLFGAGDAVSTAATTDSAAFDAVTEGANLTGVTPAVDATSVGGSTLGGGPASGFVGNLFGLSPGITGEGAPVAATIGDTTGVVGGTAPTGGTFFDSSAAAAAYGNPTAGAGGGSNFLSTLTDPSQWTLGGVAKGAGIAASGGLLGYDFLKRNTTDPNQSALQQQAGNLNAQGQQLQSYLQTGTLPPALQAQLNQATTAEKARIISGYASRGQPTDPNQNSALAQELNNVDTNAVAAMAQAQIQMLNTGLQETGLSTQLYETLVKLDQGQNDQLMKAISGFAAALGGGMGGSKQTITIGGP